VFERLLETNSMGKIFSVEIEYALYTHKALVSVSRINNEPVYHVQFIDSFLKEIFQTEHIRYEGVNGYQFCDLYDDDLAEVIIHQIATAIDHKLNGRTALIKRLFMK
jgi:hypothetical protein